MPELKDIAIIECSKCIFQWTSHIRIIDACMYSKMAIQSGKDVLDISAIGTFASYMMQYYLIAYVTVYTCMDNAQ